jgi:hypothetical protein
MVEKIPTRELSEFDSMLCPLSISFGYHSRPIASIRYLVSVSDNPYAPYSTSRVIFALN